VHVALPGFASKLGLCVRSVVPKTDELVLLRVFSVAGAFAEANKEPVFVTRCQRRSCSQPKRAVRPPDQSPEAVFVRMEAKHDVAGIYQQRQVGPGPVF